jgi:hypothetical protein
VLSHGQHGLRCIACHERAQNIIVFFDRLFAAIVYGIDQMEKVIKDAGIKAN